MSPFTPATVSSKWPRRLVGHWHPIAISSERIAARPQTTPPLFAAPAGYHNRRVTVLTAAMARVAYSGAFWSVAAGIV
jgi:hypothetical protein